MFDMKVSLMNSMIVAKEERIIHLKSRIKGLNEELSGERQPQTVEISELVNKPNMISMKSEAKGRKSASITEMRKRRREHFRMLCKNISFSALKDINNLF